MSAVNNIAALASIKFLNGPLAETIVPITRPVTTIGRDPSNDVVIRGVLTVSRHHARLICEQGVWRIENLSQKSSLIVNRRLVQEAILENQSTVVLGESTTLLFILPATTSTSADVALSLAVERAAPLLAPIATVPPPAVRPASPSGPSLSSGQGTSGGSVPPVTTFPGAGGLPPSGLNLSAVAPPLAFSESPERTMVIAPAALGIPSLEVTSTTTGQRRTYPLDGQTITIGQDVVNDIVIPDQSVSDRHLQLVRKGRQFILLHPHPDRQQTTNGLLYQGRRIRGDESYRKVLAHGDVFRIVDERGSLITLTYQDGSSQPPEIAPTMRPIKLGAEELTLGRHPDNTIVLPHPQVSGHHARLAREGGTYRLFDMNSTNHVYVNAQLVANHLLKLGDEIRIGPYRMIYENTKLSQYDESSFIRIDALGLKRAGAKGATLLNNISLSLPARSFVVLVGGSGAGKSTLLDALAGLRPAKQGTVFYNSRDLYQNLAAFNTQVGYVPQDDIVHRDLTVERALYYAAKMRLPGDFTREQIQQRIAEVLEDVELTERRGHLIKQLSGGQRKRVSIALELLAFPSVFFLDEPTSGLDPGLDRKMMLLLRKLVDKGHTVILVTHATSNINVCDFVCFLAPGGRLAYFGPPDQAKAYFGQSDFAEIYSYLDQTEQVEKISEEAEARFKVSREYQQYVAQPLREAVSSPLAASKAMLSKRPNVGTLSSSFFCSHSGTWNS